MGAAVVGAAVVGGTVVGNVVGAAVLVGAGLVVVGSIIVEGRVVSATDWPLGFEVDTTDFFLPATTPALMVATTRTITAQVVTCAHTGQARNQRQGVFFRAGGTGPPGPDGGPPVTR